MAQERWWCGDFDKAEVLRVGEKTAAYVVVAPAAAFSCEIVDMH